MSEDGDTAQDVGPASSSDEEESSSDASTASTAVDDLGPPTIPDGMVYVPAGEFWRGCDESSELLCKSDALPLARISLSAYFIDEKETTVSAYEACVEAGPCSAAGSDEGCSATLLNSAEFAMDCLTWQQASEFCQARGGELPTEAQWERAGRGDADARAYPWGDLPTPTCKSAWLGETPTGGCDTGGPTVGGTFPDSASEFGVLDMVGNVAEFTRDSYSGEAYSSGELQDPFVDNPQTAQKTSRGSMFRTRPIATVTHSLWDRTIRTTSTSEVGLGFRCAQDG